MSNPPPPPPPAPGSPAPKKGLSGLAIAGIGCGGLFAVGLLGAGILMNKACSAVKDYAVEAQKNPEKAAALLIAKMNPDIEVVSTDDAKHQITIKDKKSGKITTMSFEDIKNGKFTITDEKGETVTFDGSQAGNNGSIKIKGSEGETIIGGNSAATAAPAWVPVYPGISQTDGGGMRAEKNGVLTGAVSGNTTDSVTKVKDFYEAKLKEAGYKVESSTASAAGSETGLINATKEDGKSSINVVIGSENGKTSVMLQYQGPK